MIDQSKQLAGPSPGGGAREPNHAGAAAAGAAAAEPVRAHAAPMLDELPGGNSVDHGASRAPGDLGGMVRMVHRCLRGRYAITIALALIGAIAGGLAGWRYGHPIYHSEGLVRIAYAMPQVMQQTDQNQPLVMFD